MWFKQDLGQDEGKIEFFTEREELLDQPPVPASKFYPTWFKQMPPSHPVAPNQRYPFGLSDDLKLSNVNATVRRCPGIVSYLSEGYVIPLWSDIVVQVRANSIYAFGSNDTVYVSLHSRQMHFKTMPPRHGYYPDAVKFTNPWKVRTPRGYSLMIMAPFYHFEDRYQVLPGVIESDTYPHMHVNTLFRANEGDYTLRMGNPFIHVIPFKRDALSLEVRAASDDDKQRLKNQRFRSERFFGKNQAMRQDGEE